MLSYLIKRELFFYDKVIKYENFPLSFAQPYFGQIREDNAKFCLVLKDLKKEGWNVGSFYKSYNDQKLTQAFLEKISKLHQTYWQYQHNKEWDAMDQKNMYLYLKASILKDYPKCLELFYEEHKTEISESYLNSLKVLNLEKYLDILGQRENNKTLCHGDCHVQNMILSDDLSDLVMIDWQFMNYGVSTRDLVYFLLWSPLSDNFYQNGVAAFKKTYFELLKKGSNNEHLLNYTWESFEEDWKLGCFLFLYMAVNNFRQLKEKFTQDKTVNSEQFVKLLSSIESKLIRFFEKDILSLCI